MGSRWKGKAAEATALVDPMSKIVSRLQSSLIKSDSRGILSGYNVLLAAHLEQTEILNQACFGRPIIATEKDKQWFQLSLEEAFYLCYVMKCIKIVGGNNCPLSETELLQYMAPKKDRFPVLLKAYTYLRIKNWVVKPGSQYGVDFVAYRHHPALVHSEYAVLVISEEDGDEDGRLRVWSDFHCTLRLCGSVAKTLLILFIIKNGDHGDVCSSCMDNFNVEERIITRWIPEHSRENHGTEPKKSFKSQA
ncbi:tRNA-splicing endonuclease subunit Sen2-1-like [Dorcoceras hygrometricum]|uniref:tRNA-intron lyase n=1 Tax=Dorcoceras hygrometricum TaxID=472368 RepID=A0A2Z7CZQ4_9LAMI|nr:tRNA-splicing endonuclease subunit Sen2-1-like [Dorcoceras hygrometricum]